MKGIATALAKAQANMGKALKQANNPHFRTKYADLGNVMDACLPALNEAGIALIQPTGEDDHGRYVETTLIHGESGESLTCRVPLIVTKNDMQAYGSAVTYARRYGLMAMAGIAPEDDDGNDAAKAAPKQDQHKAQEADDEAIERAKEYLTGADSLDELVRRWKNTLPHIQRIPAVIETKNKRKAEFEPKKPATQTADVPPSDDAEIPY